MERTPTSAAGIFMVGLFIVVFFAAALFLHHTFSAVLTSLVLAYLVNPLLKRLEALGMGRTASLALIYLLLAVVGAVLAFLLLPVISVQMDSLQEALPSYIEKVRMGLAAFRDTLSRHIGPEDSAWLVSQVDGAIARVGSELSGQGYRQLKGLLYTMFNLVLAPILVFFMLLYKEKARRVLLIFTPEPFRDELILLGTRINDTLERFILAMFLDCFLVGILCSLSLWALDIDFYLLNGMVAGFASAVPFIGAFLAFLPPALIGFSAAGDPLIVLKVAAAYFFVNIIIEGNIIKPLVMRGTLRLNPLWVVFAVMAMGEMMGFWGILLAIPLAAVIKICTAELRDFLVQT
jgi:predicted PurR-regulated permease PerM